jgi:Predicted signal transduction protein containing a membrane domain, an EAL and a GGDEF domain
MELKKKIRLKSSFFAIGAVVFSIVFVLASTHVWAPAEFLLLPLLSVFSGLCLVGGLSWWKSGAKKRRAATLLLASIVFEYWCWALFASYPTMASTAFLLCIEPLRLIVILLVVRFLRTTTGIDGAYTLWSAKFLIFDILVLITSRAGGGAGTSLWEQINILHPLFLAPLILNCFVQANLLLWYVVKYRKADTSG